MLLTSAISLSGMNAAGSTLQVSAHNIANLATDGFRRQHAVQSSVLPGGVSTTFAQAADPGHAAEADMVGLLQAKKSVHANLAVFRARDRKVGAVVDAVS